MTPALMAPAICRSGSLWFRLLQLGIAIVEKCTKQGKTYSVTPKTDAKNHNCNIEEKVHTELLCPSISTVTTYLYKKSMLADHRPILHTT